MKKNIYSLIIAGTLSLTLVACGSAAENDAVAPEAQTEIADEAVPESAEITEDDDAAERLAAAMEENSNAFIRSAAEQCAPTIDISECDTFTNIVDQKLDNGMGYANVSALNTDLLLVSSGTYDDLDGHMSAIDATAFAYSDDGIVEVGKLCSGGTAYPLTVKDGYLYSGSNHWICKYVVSDNQLMIMEKASVVYDDEGNGTYYYESEDGGDYSKMDSSEAENIYNTLLNEMFEGKVIDFQPVTK